MALLIAACTPAVTVAPSASTPSGDPSSSAFLHTRQDCTIDGPCLGTIRLMIAGGPRAGRYVAAWVVHGICARNAFGPNTFEMESGVLVDHHGLFGVLAYVLDAKAAALGTDKKFKVLIEFKSATDSLSMSPGQDTPLGSGVVTLADRGTTASIHAKGTLEDGSTGTVDVECLSVTDV